MYIAIRFSLIDSDNNMKVGIWPFNTELFDDGISIRDKIYELSTMFRDKGYKINNSSYKEISCEEYAMLLFEGNP